MKRAKNGYTRKQFNYAQMALNGNKTKQEIALDAGYSPSVAVSVSSHIEKTEGYANAMAKLASDAGNVALKVFHELQGRNLKDEKTETLLKAVTVLADAFDKFTPKTKKEDDNKRDNPLRAIILTAPDIKTVKAIEKDQNQNA